MQPILDCRQNAEARFQPRQFWKRGSAWSRQQKVNFRFARDSGVGRVHVDVVERIAAS